MIQIGLSILDLIDYLIFVLLIIFNVVLWFKRVKLSIVKPVIIVFIGVVFPIWSMSREINQSTIENGPAVDSFELLYVFSFFSVYWIFLAVLALNILILERVSKLYE